MSQHATALPEWDGVIKRWATRYIHRNLWRVQSIYSYEDLLSDARLKYEICKQRYGHVKEPRHFMALFQRALQNHIHTLSNKASVEVREADLASKQDSEEAHDVPYYDVFGARDWNYGMLKILLAEAPDEVKALLELLTDETRLNELRQEHERYKLGIRTLQEGGLYSRETTAQFYARLLGIDPDCDIVALMRRHFGQL